MIRVVRDDLAFLPVDAVLRPASDLLEPTDAAATRLDRLAGDRFARDRRTQTALEIGAAVVTGAGELAAQFVIHAVVRTQDRNPDRDAVRRALVSAWQRAADWQLVTVAAPLVGAGAGQLDTTDAAHLLIETFRARLDTAYPAELSIVVERDEDRALVDAILTRAMA